MKRQYQPSDAHMNFTNAVLAIRWLTHDTFRQSLASRVFWVMLVVSGVAILVCSSVGISGDMPVKETENGDYQEFIPESEARKVDPNYLPGEGVNVIKGKMTILFGTVEVPLGRTRLEAVRHVQLMLAGGVADTLGLLLALVWTAGFLPSFLEPASATVLLAKPVPRWSILLGKCLGVLLFLLVQATVFVLGTWLALGLKTAVWDPLYLLCIPLLLLHFAIFFSFSAFLAVWTRSTVICVFGSILFWFICWGMNFGHHASAAMHLQQPPDRVSPVDVSVLAANPLAPIAPASFPWPALNAPPQATVLAATKPQSSSPLFLEVGYWLLPKPADIGNLLFHSLRADSYFSQLGEFDVLRKYNAFHPELSILSSLLFMVATLALAACEFVRTDY